MGQVCQKNSTHLIYVFVHGTAGWGSYDTRNERMPYWGMRGGDVLAYLRERGFDCHAASVSPFGSAWDRACELFAQLSGTQVDYGLSHSQTYGHRRIGDDFSGHPLIGTFDDQTKLVIIGHSFGGTTARLFAELMAHGDKTEQAATNPSKTSPLFTGGMGARITAVVCIACALNGNPSLDMFDDPNFDPAAIKVPWWSKPFGKRMSDRVTPAGNEANLADCANFDMRIDNALTLNERMDTLSDVYYFSVPCSYTRQAGYGQVPERGMEPFFIERSLQMGHYAGTTPGGIPVSKLWQENDGRVSTISEIAPLNAPCQDLNPADIQPGIWNVLPIHHGDHMSLQGGLIHKKDVRAFYTDLLTMIEGVARG